MKKRRGDEIQKDWSEGQRDREGVGSYRWKGRERNKREQREGKREKMVTEEERSQE